MKKLLITIAITLLSVIYVNAQSGVAVNTTGAAADPSAMLDVSSSDKGVLIPRMTEAERTAIAVPARGLMVYQIDNSEGFWYFDGSAWTQFGDNLGNHIASDSLDMANKKIINLATCTQNSDAANKEYVDNAVSAGGGGSSKPSMISNESAADYTLSEAVQYCENLTEGGYTDWSLPTFDEIGYFFGSVANTNFIWTKTMASGKENPVNQHYVTVRLSDGKYRNGGEHSQAMFLSVTGNTLSSSFVNVGTISPSTPGNWLKISKFTLEAAGQGSYYNYAYVRLIFNYTDGSSNYSPTYSKYSSGYAIVMDWTNIQEPISLLSIDVEAYTSSTSYNAYGRLTISGNEITPHQKDGNKLFCRCVR